MRNVVDRNKKIVEKIVKEYNKWAETRLIVSAP